jgi:hypothetical protein
VIPCKFHSKIIETYGDGISYDGMYLGSSPVYTEKQNLFLVADHPYSEEFQRIMDWSFGAGLLVAWENFYYRLYQANGKVNSEKNILDFNAIMPFFFILAFGFVIALFALLGEIFYHDFLGNLSKKFIKSKFGKFKKFKRVNVRKIQVRCVRK